MLHNAKLILFSVAVALLFINQNKADEFEFNTEFKEPNYQGISYFHILDDNLLFYVNWREIGTVDLQTKKYLWKNDGRYQHPFRLTRLTNNQFIISERYRDEKGENYKLINPYNGDEIWSKFIEHNYSTDYVSISSFSLGSKIISSISPDEPTTDIDEVWDQSDWIISFSGENITDISEKKNIKKITPVLV